MQDKGHNERKENSRCKNSNSPSGMPSLIAWSARKALQDEIFPQLEDGVTDLSSIDPLRDEAKETISQGFRAKNEVYTRLIMYKSIDQSDIQYLSDLIEAIDYWAIHLKKILGAPDSTISRPPAEEGSAGVINPLARSVSPPLSSADKKDQNSEFGNPRTRRGPSDEDNVWTFQDFRM